MHRVQRVPVTESTGRIHTSTATVAVLPEVEEVEVHIDPNEVRVDVYRSTGPGGQSVNTTDSAVRLTHVPTGLVVSCQDEKSQLQNKERAFRILRARLYDIAQAEQDAKVAAQRRSQVGTGDRAQKIRTYNFPQGRVTDHRVGLTSHRMEAILQGELEEFTEALQAQRPGGATRRGRLLTGPEPASVDGGARGTAWTIGIAAGDGAADYLAREGLLARRDSTPSCCWPRRWAWSASISTPSSTGRSHRGEVDAYRALVARRAQHEPVAYILGRAHFRHLTLEVTPGRAHPAARDRGAGRGRCLRLAAGGGPLVPAAA